MRTKFSVFLAVALAGNAMAQPSVKAMTDEVTDNVATDYAECSAYVAIIQGAFANSNMQIETRKFKDASDRAAQFSLLAAKQSRRDEMATKVTLARIDMSMKEMMKIIDNNYSNISLLMNKHSDRCVEAMNDSKALMQRWAEKVQVKHGVSNGK